MSADIGKHILVVDDEEDVRNYLSMALKDAGFRVSKAKDGYEAIEMVRKEPPDLISLDLVMPKRSGARFYQDLQKDPELARIPVIIVTGHARDAMGKVDFEELTMSGVGVYLEKPVKPHSYVSAVCRMLGVPNPLDSAENGEELKQKLSESLEKASMEDLKRALEALKKKGK